MGTWRGRRCCATGPIWQAAEVLYWLAVWSWLAGALADERYYAAATLVRVVATAYLWPGRPGRTDRRHRPTTGQVLAAVAEPVAG